MKIVNGPIMAHPLNWLIIWLMVISAAIAGHLVMDACGILSPHDSEQQEKQ